MSNAEELKDMVPDFWPQIKEIDAIYDTQGGMLDDLDLARAAVIDNGYISSMDADACARMETFYKLYPLSSATLEERRADILGIYRGPGKLSASRIKQIVEPIAGVIPSVVIDKTAGEIQITLTNSTLSTAKQAILLDKLSRRVPRQYVVILAIAMQCAASQPSQDATGSVEQAQGVFFDGTWSFDGTEEFDGEKASTTEVI